MGYCKCDRCIHDDKNGGTEKACEKCVGWSGDEFMFREICDFKYPRWIMNSVRQTLDLDPDDMSEDDRINKMSKQQVFRRMLEWEGIIGYDHRILGWIEDIFDVNLMEE